MGHGKLRKFAENETFSCLLQPSAEQVLAEGYFNLADHPVKGRWIEQMFGGHEGDIVLELGCGKGEYTLELARRNPDKNYIGVDIKGARLWRGAKTATEEGLRNVAFLRTRIEFITAFFGPRAAGNGDISPGTSPMRDACSRSRGVEDPRKSARFPRLRRGRRRR